MALMHISKGVTSEEMLRTLGVSTEDTLSLRIFQIYKNILILIIIQTNSVHACIHPSLHMTENSLLVV